MHLSTCGRDSQLIHSSAVIDPRAEIAAGVSVGPYAIIEGRVTIGEDSVVGPHSVIKGPCRIGRENRIFQFASVGEEPQDLKYKGEPTTLEIGDRNTIREFATLCRGTAQGIGSTRLGDDNLVMAYAHIAHDCVVNNHTVFANGASLAGHVEVGDWAILGGFALIHQFCRLGAHSFCSMGSVVRNDVPPYVTVSGDPATPSGINSEGLRRRLFSPEQIQMVKQGYRIVYRSGLRVDEAVEQLRLLQNPNGDLLCLADFVASSERGIVR